MLERECFKCFVGAMMLLLEERFIGSLILLEKKLLLIVPRSLVSFVESVLLTQMSMFCSGFNANGACTFLPGLFVTAAFCLSLSASGLCNFAKLDDDNPFTFPKAENAGVHSVGFWCFEQEGTGNRYSLQNISLSDDLDRARAFGLTANILGFIAWLLYLFMTCVPFPPMVFAGMGFWCELVCLFEGLKFWIFKAPVCDEGCSLDTGAKCSISAAVCWFLAGCMACAQAKERSMAAEKEEEGEKDQEEGEVREA